MKYSDAVAGRLKRALHYSDGNEQRNERTNNNKKLLDFEKNKMKYINHQLKSAQEPYGTYPNYEES